MLREDDTNMGADWYVAGVTVTDTAGVGYEGVLDILRLIFVLLNII